MRTYHRYYIEAELFRPNGLPFKPPTELMHQARLVIGIDKDGKRTVEKDLRGRVPETQRQRHEGRRVFVDDFDQYYGPTYVIESSLAFEGAHCWIIQDCTRLEVNKGPQQQVHLNVEGARKVIAALQAFVYEAEDNELLEGVDPIPEEPFGDPEQP